MLDNNLSKMYPFLTDYFENILKEGTKIPQGILFYGQDISIQYEFALEIARILNCNGTKDRNCNCINCRWIRDKAHPAVLTITNIDNKPTGDETKTVISIKQTQMVKSMLVNTSDNYRVIIFCGAKIKNDVWQPIGLNFENFKAEAANSMLKIVEEAPKKTLFFFLTNDKTDIITTILSRCQSFYVPSFLKENNTISGVKSIFEDYPNFKTEKLFEYCENFQNNLQNYDNLFDKCQNYLLNILKQNLNNGLAKQKIIKDIKTFEQAKQKYKIGIKPELIADDLFINLIKQ